MAIFLEKKPTLIRNGIVEQVKQAANSLTIQEWNNVVNTLKLQSNLTVEYLEKLHRSLFGLWGSNTTELQEFLDEGVIYTLLNAITNIRNELANALNDAALTATLKTNFYGKADEAITKGDFIMFGGTQGDHILFVKANVNAIGFIPEYIVGVAESNMAKGDFGYVRWFGQVTELALTPPAGTLLWVGQTPGSFTTTKPTSGPRILMAVVEKQSTGNASNGIMLVRPTLSSAGELDLENAQDGDFVRYDAASGYFKDIKANKVVVAETIPTDNKDNDIWFDLAPEVYVNNNVIVYTSISGGEFDTSSYTNTLSGGTFDVAPVNIITGGNF
jgi:hypothetical protein